MQKKLTRNNEIDSDVEEVIEGEKSDKLQESLIQMTESSSSLTVKRKNKNSHRPHVQSKKLRLSGVSKVNPPVLIQPKRRKRMIIVDSEDDADGDSSPDSSVSDIPQRRKSSIRVKWTEEQLDIMRKELSNFLRTESLPGWKEIEAMTKKCPAVFESSSREKTKARFVHLKKTGH